MSTLLSRCFVTAALSASIASTAAAAPDPEPAAPQASPFHADVEVDPTAYVLDGDSIHVGLGYRQFRLDLGVFALALPQFAHGDDGFDVSFGGFGAKLQWFPLAEQRGLVVGVDGGYTRVLARRQ